MLGLPGLKRGIKFPGQKSFFSRNLLKPVSLVIDRQGAEFRSETRGRQNNMKRDCFCRVVDASCALLVARLEPNKTWDLYDLFVLLFARKLVPQFDGGS